MSSPNEDFKQLYIDIIQNSDQYINPSFYSDYGNQLRNSIVHYVKEVIHGNPEFYNGNLTRNLNENQIKWVINQVIYENSKK